MQSTDLLPLAILATVPVATLLQRAIRRCLPVALLLNVTGYLCAGLLFALHISHPAVQLTPLLIIDSFGCFYASLISAAAIAIALISYTYVKKLPVRHDEYYLFLSIATLGATAITFANHFAAFFLGLETLSVSLYALIAYRRTAPQGIEGAIKYLILAGVASAFLLFGLGLLYLETGTLALAHISPSPIVLAAVAMILVGMGFKLAIVPFYLWTPDIYQGAPAPVSAFIASISKGAVFVFFLRFFMATGLPSVPVVMGIAIASMFVGTLLALFQENVKRLLAYSSIAHLGYLLVALIANGSFAQQAVAMYLTAYFITIVGAFGIITVLSNHNEDLERLSACRGLAWHHPVLGCIFALMLFSLAGLPLTAGFIGKVYILRAAISSNLWLPVIVLIITSTIGLFYYLRVIFALFAREEQPLPRIASVSGSITLIVLTLLLFWLGIYPMRFAEFLSSSALTMAQG
jgi:NADH-quinone oxidoreductase subunit N